jgi:hypothetical protein
MKRIYCPHCSEEFTRKWNMNRHISNQHRLGTPSEYLPNPSTIRTTSNVYSPRAGSTNSVINDMWRKLLAQKLDHITDLQNTTNNYLANIFLQSPAKRDFSDI